MPTAVPAKRVAFVAPGWPPSMFPNGVVTYIANMRPALLAQGFASSVITDAAGVTTDPEVANLLKLRRERSLHVKVMDRALYKLWPDQSMALRSAHALVAALRAHRKKFPVHLLEMEEAFGVAARVQSRVDLPVIVRLHGPWFMNGAALGVPRDDAFHARIREERAAIAEAAAVTAPSFDVLQRVREHYGLPLPDAAVIPNPGPEVPAEETWQQSEADARNVLFVGRFDKHKGGDLVIDAFAKLAKSDRSLTLSFAGPDRGLDMGDGTKLQITDYIEQHVPDPSIRERIRVLGPQPTASLPALRRKAALTVVASRYETFAMVALEAIAYGSPLIAPAAGGITELVRDEATALVFKPGDADDLATKMERLLGDPVLAQRLAVAGRHDYETRLAPAVAAERMAKFYQRVLDRA